VWLLTVAPDGGISTRLDTNATVRYDTVLVELSGCTTESEARDITTAALRAWLHTVCTHAPELRHVALRVQLRGRTPLHGQLHPLTELVRDVRDLGVPVPSGADLTLSVTHVELATSAERDLALLAAGSDPVAVLARLLLSLQQGEPIEPSLEQRLRPLLPQLRDARVFAGAVRADALSAEAVHRALAVQADRLLDTLLRQRESSS
jgi:hypothetical protein